jgi:hypothetical protein
MNNGQIEFKLNTINSLVILGINNTEATKLTQDFSFLIAKLNREGFTPYFAAKTILKHTN